MRYVSTRGHAAQPSFSEILLGGLAPDGGLYLPAGYPQVTGAELDAWRALSYADLALAILGKFATDVPHADLKALTDKTYTADVYRNTRPGESAERITPLHVIEQDGDKTLLLQALSNGPTLAFKDMANAIARQPVRVHARQAAGRTQYLWRDLRRHRQRCRIRDARQARHPRLHALAAPENELLSDRANVQPAGRQHLQHRRQGCLRRLPGHGQGGLE
ncbi:Threonine synthase [Oxalobacteraceae bacterium IMCC9480]|nr:Threonine synthase [Oxalobacteraceae bacterium IMCC9480]